MAGKKKLQHFKEMESFTNVLQPTFEEVFKKRHKLNGKWGKDVFENENPVVLELGCGKGEYTVGLSAAFPNKNFIGIDIKGARMWRGAKTALTEGRRNAFFIRSRIELIEAFFAKDEIDEIWITFPDPQPRESREKKRLTSPRFLDIYRKFMKPGGTVHLKTDSLALHQYTREVVEAQNLPIQLITENLYSDIPNQEGLKEMGPLLHIRTHYEQLFMDQGYPITYLQFQLT